MPASPWRPGRRETPTPVVRGNGLPQLFVLANVPKPILGMDFFQDNNIGIDTKGERERLIVLGAGHGWTGGMNSDPSAQETASIICHVSVVETGPSEFEDILSKYPEIKTRF